MVTAMARVVDDGGVEDGYGVTNREGQPDLIEPRRGGIGVDARVGFQQGVAEAECIDAPPVQKADCEGLGAQHVVAATAVQEERGEGVQVVSYHEQPAIAKGQLHLPLEEGARGPFSAQAGGS